MTSEKCWIWDKLVASDRAGKGARGPHQTRPGSLGVGLPRRHTPEPDSERQLSAVPGPHGAYYVPAEELARLQPLRRGRPPQPRSVSADIEQRALPRIEEMLAAKLFATTSGWLSRCSPTRVCIRPPIGSSPCAPAAGSWSGDGRGRPAAGHL
jgi:hypothetical protein